MSFKKNANDDYHIYERSLTDLDADPVQLTFGTGRSDTEPQYLANGNMTEEELLAKAGEGVYITDLSGLHAGANAVSGDFSLQSAGFMIRDGKKAEYVKSFTVAGNFYEMLKNIRALADNCTLPRAMGMTTFGSPSVLVDGLSVAGK